MKTALANRNRLPGIAPVRLAGQLRSAGLSSRASSRSFPTPISRVDVQPVLGRALRELGAEVWTEEQARRHHLVEIAAAMARREVAVDEGLREIHRTILSPLKHPKDLQVWCDLSDGFFRY